MKKAFTLAEVLITLMIIGIVAALTIPSVISNYQQQEFKTGLKKAVSVLNEAITTTMAIEGVSPLDTEVGWSSGDLKTLPEYLIKHMSVINTKTWAHGGNIDFYTTDGMRFSIPSYDSISSGIILHESGLELGNFVRCVNHNCSASPSYTCGSYGLATNLNNTKTPPCIVSVDVNGDKKPNPAFGDYFWANGDLQGSGEHFVYAKPTDKKINDMFAIMITEDRAIPFGVVAQRAMYSK